MDLFSGEQAQTPVNPVRGGDIRKVIQCLIDWLEENPSDGKAHQILRTLAKESLKVVASEESVRRFTGPEIVEALGEVRPNANDWINWTGTVIKYWNTKEKQIIKLARERGLESYPKPHRISTTGGPHLTTYLIRAEPLPEIINGVETESPQEQLGEAAEQQTTIYYEIAENGEVKPGWGAQWLFNDGQIRLSKRRMWTILIGLFVLFLSVIAFSYVSWITLSVPKPVTTRELTLLISIFGFPYAFWIFFIKPWLRMFEDRIVPAPESFISLQQKSAQLEVLRDGDLRLIRLVCYSATCPICGATIHLDDGSPDYPRRLVGRCYDSPREHIYSFDRVTQKGTVLRSPII
ncbi:MAG: hypothetical protein ACXW00_00470 [Methylobacter sp.]